MKKLLIPIFGFRAGKYFTKTRRRQLEIPDSVWNNTEIFSEVDLTYSQLVTKVSPYLPSIGIGKPTTAKFKAYVKLYGLSLYLNNRYEFDNETFVFENRWQPNGEPDNKGYIIVRNFGGI